VVRHDFAALVLRHKLHRQEHARDGAAGQYGRPNQHVGGRDVIEQARRVQVACALRRLHSDIKNTPGVFKRFFERQVREVGFQVFDEMRLVKQTAQCPQAPHVRRQVLPPTAVFGEKVPIECVEGVCQNFFKLVICSSANHGCNDGANTASAQNPG